MATVVTAPERYSPDVHPGFTVFLAGAIDMGAAEDWQALVIKTLADMQNVVLFNPRRSTPFTPDMETQQIAWELTHLESARAILMWLPASSKAPVSMFEAGLYLRTGKLCLGVAPGFYRRRNLEMTATMLGVRVHNTLLETINAVLAREH